MSLADDEAKVRRYLRAIVGAPIGSGVTTGPAEADFVRVASRWCARSGVDRHTLRDLGVPAGVLDKAGIQQPTASELAAPHLGDGAITVAVIAQRAGLSASVARKAVVELEESGRLVRDRAGSPRPKFTVSRA